MWEGLDVGKLPKGRGFTIRFERNILFQGGESVMSAMWHELSIRKLHRELIEKN